MLTIRSILSIPHMTMASDRIYVPLHYLGHIHSEIDVEVTKVLDELLL